MPSGPTTFRPFGVAPQAARKVYDRFRGSAASRGYDHKWRAFRDSFLAANPLCADCSREDRVTAASEVHHVVKLRDRPDLRLDAANCMALCQEHHAARTAKGQ